jgi:hypothetical protein
VNHRLLILFPSVWMVSAVAEAGETGNLRGEVVDGQGLAVPNALVTLSGANLAGVRQVQADASGGFKLIALPPGQHDIRIEAAGFKPTISKVVVRLDETATVQIALQMAVGSEEIVVEAELPVIDTTRSAISSEISASQLQNLPVGRSYQDAVNTIPGVYGRVNTQEGGPSTGNPSVRGEGSYGNNYLVDGISTRDPATKTFGSDVNFDAIESIQVYTDGAPAEFGQATGMTVNVVTKDGGDKAFGSVGYYVNFDASPGTYKRLNLDTGLEEATKKRDFFNQELSLTAGGAVVKEKLWYFVALEGSYNHILYEGMPEAYPYSGPSVAGFAKLTWFVTPDFTLQYQISPEYSSIANHDTSGVYAPEAQERRLDKALGHIFTMRWRPSGTNELEFKVSYLPTSLDSVPMSDDEDVPSIQNVDTGQYTQNYGSYDINKRSRFGGSLKFTQLINDFVGDHRVKTGAEAWVLHDSRELSFTGPSGEAVDASWDEDLDPQPYDGIQYYSSPSAGLPCTEAAGYTDCYGFRAYQDVGEPLGHKGSIFGAFLQDDWQPIEPLTLNLGVRVDYEALYQNNGDKVVGNVMPAPRFGLAWDITKDSRTLLSVNAGRYFDLSGNTFAGWGDTRSSFIYGEYRRDPSTGDYYGYYEQNPETDPLVYCTESSISQYEDFLKELGYVDGAIKEERKLVDKYCGDGLKPYHMDKAVIGIQREVIPLLAVGIRAIVSETTNLPEDVDTNLTTWVITNPESKRRDYKALELTVERKYDERWQAMVGYTLSAAKGTNPGQFELSSGGQSGSNGNEVGVYLDDVNDPAWRDIYYGAAPTLIDGLNGLGTTSDTAGWYGYLPYHSFHQVKASGYYSIPEGSMSTTLGLVYEFDSGHAWQKRGFVEIYGDYMGFPEGRGTRTMPAVHYVDFHVGQKFNFRESGSLEVTADIFNLPDLETPITYYENDNASFGTVLYRQEPRSMRLGLKVNY